VTLSSETSKDALRRFARELHLALTFDEVWAVFLSRVTDVVKCDGFGIYRFADGLLSVESVNATVSGALLERYETDGRKDDPVLDFLLEYLLPADETRATDGKTWASSSTRAILAAEGLGHSLEAPLLGAGGLIGTINLARAEQEQAFCDEDLRLARFLSEHLSLAMERAARYESTGLRSGILEGVLDQMSQGVCVNDLRGHPIFVNRNARKMLGGREKSGIRSKGEITKLVDDVVADFIKNGHRSQAASVRDRGTGQQLIVKSYSDVSRGWVVSFLFECADSDRDVLPAWGVLSPREQEIAEFVSQGLNTKQIASRAFVSENTVKQHLKRIFAKTDVHSRAELIQLIWASKRSREDLSEMSSLADVSSFSAAG
jgi:Response regulator containing a CheY-like receiver domain and an HTH DNA-binding domain